MSSNLNELDQQSVAILFGESLYNIDPHPQKVAADPRVKALPAEQVAAAVKADTTILLRDPLKNGSSTHTMFLKLLEACKLSPNQTNILAPFTFDINARSLVQQYSPTRIIMFGVGSSEIGLPVYFPDFQVQDVEGVLYLTAPDLTLIENNAELKKTLWLSLQKIFAL